MFRLIIFGLFVIYILGCDTGFHVPDKSQIACTVTQTSYGALITCPDGTSTTITNGSQGPQGNAGNNGLNGLNALVASTVADAALCSNGGYVLTMGQDSNSDGVLEMNEVQYTDVICNGTNGSSAPPTPFSPVALLAPCAANPMHPTAQELSNPDLEVFIQLSNGTILDSFSENISGYDTHFGVLSPGTYESTGAGNCVFTLNTNRTITK